MIVTKQHSDFPASIDAPTLHYACRLYLSPYGYQALTVYLTTVDFTFSADPGPVGLSTLDSVVAAHTGVPTPIPTMYEPISLVPTRYAVTATTSYEEVASIVSRVESIVNNLPTSFAYLLGAYSCYGSPRIRIMCEPIGGTAFELMSAVDLPDTVGTTQKLALQTPVGTLPTGYAVYTLEAKLNGATSLELVGLTVTPMEL